MVAMHQGTGIGGSIIKPPGSDRPMYLGRKPGGIGGCTITEEAQCCGAVGKRHVFPYWLVFEADVVLQRDASHVFWLLQHRDKGP